MKSQILGKMEILLDNAFKEVKAYSPDILYIYSDFRFFGQYLSEYKDKNAFCEAIVNPLLIRGKTIIVPTFSYTTSGQFDVLKTPTKLGTLNKWILSHKNHVRSEHPLFSYSALGPNAKIISNIGKSAFGADSVFERLRDKNTAFLHIGRPVHLGNTLLHYIEQICGASYRTHKAFSTEVYRDKKYIGTDYSAFLRRLDINGYNFFSNFVKATNYLENMGIVAKTGSDSDLSNITLYCYDRTIEILQKLFYTDQNIFIEDKFMQY